MRSKARLTITLAKDLLAQIDRMIDDKTIRNRSHAIETLLRESLMARVTTAVILTGGKSKIHPVPALLSIEDKRLIFITIRHLVSFGIRTIYILAGPNELELKDVLGEGRVLGADIRFVHEPTPLGTAGALKHIEDKLTHEPFLVLHGDVLTDINLSDFIAFHKRENSLATIAVKPREAERKYGKVLLQGNKITHFTETNNSDGISIVNTGVYLLQPEALKLLEPGQPAHFEKDIFPKLAAINELSAFFFQGIWFDISKPENFQLAEVRWANR